VLSVVIKRVLIGIPTLIGVTIALFLALRVMPGDPVSVLLAGNPATPEQIAALKHQFGLDGSLVHQYWIFITSLLHWDLGTSYQYRQPVTTLISQQIGSTIELALAAALVSAVVGIALGATAAIFRNTWVDNAIRVGSLIVTAMPSFWVGVLLIEILSFAIPIFPATGSGSFMQLVLPAATLGLSAAGTVTRLVRNSVIEVLGENFVTALYAKGLRQRVVIFKHVLRNAVIPTVTIVGLQIGALLAGAVIVETVFSRRGIGRMLIAAIDGQDYPMIQAIVLIIAIAYIGINIIVDVSYSFIDPRIRSAVTNKR
jgi:ABC-type dipeptide/oligopeptide/nickel transport system permease component